MAEVTLLLAGDVMTGRGVDQILPHPGPPALREPAVTDARRYVELAESVNGPVPRPAPPEWPWGETLRLLDGLRPDVRIVNLETSVTGRGEYAPGKDIHYRMHPGNLACLTAARLDVCALANNHVLDFGPIGLADTLDALRGAGLSTAGAGRNADEAWRPAVVPLPGGRRLLVWSVGAPSSGVYPQWAAAEGRPGVAYLDVSAASAGALAERVAREARPGDLLVVSVHWGSNWGYEVPDEHVRFAHMLIDAGVHLVHGHSSHHPRPIERYRGRLVLYGCGDLIDDYEGIGGQESYRPELRLLHLPTLDVESGELRRLRLVPVRARRMRLELAAPEDARWLADLLDGLGAPYRTRFAFADDGLIALRPD
ncbi:poly-gamma-glutamate synthesis protein (capsule biosynthesis protein) [Micromonospora viridifaciens]|uniref:Poly-gamma-glutamate synthesis protein (Capsule biosynthesis protein) n=1 Tax=Micromonospora viridifaciens TaxID=1881 RepID=A0A1C4XXP3_MICVI|nr:CapA family protein [Micromonospora viridifaciens]SCF13116.1 poly-gamma-glutamate synthesis protein (capsule biosynthesis protein) [Micromonospora viridifaciens]